MGAHLTPEQIELFKQAHAEGLSRKGTAEKVGCVKSTVDRLRTALKEGKIDEWKAIAEKFAARQPVPRAPRLPTPHAIVRHRPNLAERARAAERGEKPKPKFLAKLILLTREGKAPGEIAAKLHISIAMVYYWRTKAGLGARQNMRPVSGRPPKESGLREKIEALKQQGYSVAEIAAKVGRPKSTISYYLYQSRLHSQEETNGTDPRFNKSFRLGIAYCETTRYIGVLGERLGFAPEVLGRELSELLGLAPLRSQRRLNN